MIKSQHSKNVKTFFKLEPERNVFFDFWNYKNDEKANKFLNFSLNKSKTILREDLEGTACTLYSREKMEKVHFRK